MLNVRYCGYQRLDGVICRAQVARMGLRCFRHLRSGLAEAQQEERARLLNGLEAKIAGLEKRIRMRHLQCGALAQELAALNKRLEALQTAHAKLARTTPEPRAQQQNSGAQA